MFLDRVEVRQAISRIVLRADNLSTEDIQGTFVDTGIVDQIVNINDQIIFGRRGTGKSHLLKYAGPKLEASKNNGIHIYIDPRTLSSASEASRTDISVQERQYSLIRDLSKSIYARLHNQAVEFSTKKNVMGLLEKIEEACSGLVLNKIPIKSTEKTEFVEDKKLSAKGTAKIGFDVFEIGAGGSVENGTHRKVGADQEYEFKQYNTVRYGALADSIKNYLNRIDAHLFVLIDEWSSIDINLQPYIAEFIKRVLLSEERVTVKIGAIKARTKLRDAEVGMELGADISGALNLDDYFIFDRDPVRVTHLFSEILYRHFANAISPHILYSERVNSSDQMEGKIFDSRAFVELTISAEGVIRDFINIFKKSVDSCRIRGNQKITKLTINGAAISWYREDKREALNDASKRMLQQIVKNCKENKARALLAPIEHRNNPVLQGLVDQRVVHVLASAIDVDFQEYDLYTIDYGAYAEAEGGAIRRVYERRTGGRCIQPFPPDKIWIVYLKVK